MPRTHFGLASSRNCKINFAICLQWIGRRCGLRPTFSFRLHSRPISTDILIPVCTRSFSHEGQQRGHSRLALPRSHEILPRRILPRGRADGILSEIGALGGSGEKYPTNIKLSKDIQTFFIKYSKIVSARTDTQTIFLANRRRGEIFKKHHSRVGLSRKYLMHTPRESTPRGII